MADSIELIKSVLVWEQNVTIQRGKACGIPRDGMHTFIGDWCNEIPECRQCPMRALIEVRELTFPPLIKNIKQRESNE